MKELIMSSGNMIKWKNIRFGGTKRNRGVIKPSAAGQRTTPPREKLWLKEEEYFKSDSSELSEFNT